MNSAKPNMDNSRTKVAREYKAFSIELKQKLPCKFSHGSATRSNGKQLWNVSHGSATRPNEEQVWDVFTS